MSQIAYQKFNKGLHTESDIHSQPPGTYRKSVNGDIMFNRDGTFSWSNSKGNSLSFSLVDYNGNPLTGYAPIGCISFDDKVVILSANVAAGFSEIGYVDFDNDGIGVYTQVFNDEYDPNGEKLRFSNRHNISGTAERENVEVEMIYWNDGKYNEDRCLNILLGASFNYTPTAGQYPYWYSVHSMGLMCDHRMGELKFQMRFSGALKTGAYQYCYRGMTKDGRYATPWTPMMRKIFLNTNTISFVNHLDYQMQPSGIITDGSIRLQLEGFDNRFPILEVAYIYSISEDQSVEAGIFYHNEFASEPPLAITIEHEFLTGDPVSIEELQRVFRTIPYSKDINIKDNYLVRSNLTEVGVLEPDLSAATIAPITRLMAIDEQPLTQLTSPLTHVTPSILDTVTIKAFTGVNREFNISSDYANYKGMQWAHLFPGYWRGETYRFGCMLFDKKGNPNFVFHIRDFTFPQQYDNSATNDYTLTKLDADGKYKIQIMGATISGIKIPDSILYDKDGNINVSGMMIVRADRIKNVLFQSLVTNTVYEACQDEENGVLYNEFTRPLPLTTNKFVNWNTAGFAGALGTNARVYGNATGGTSNILTRSCIDGETVFLNREGTFLFYSPDIMFDATETPVNTQTDRIRIVGNVKAPYSQDGTNVFSGGANFCHMYSKNYDTTLQGHVGDHEAGNTSFIQGEIRKTQLNDEFADTSDYDFLNLDLVYTQRLFTQPGTGYCSSCGSIPLQSYGVPGSLLMSLKDFKDLGVIYNSGGSERVCDFFLVNYERPSNTYSGINPDDNVPDVNSLEDTVYMPIGHFQPINQDVIDATSVSGGIQFDDVEVYGGDCYVNLFDFARLLPRYKDCEQESGCYQDYAVGMIFPIESNLNFSMRYGRQFANDITEPEITACEDGSTSQSNGIQPRQREDFNLNSVLQLQENVRYYPAIPAETKNIKDWPAQGVISMLKFNGQARDSYRYNQPNDFINVTGTHGEITATFLLNNYLYFLQLRAFGRYFLDERGLIPDFATGVLQTGQADRLTGFMYIDEKIGCQHHFGLHVTDRFAYWVDANISKHFRFGGDGLTPVSDIYGMHTEFNEACREFRDRNLDNPGFYGGIHMAYDAKNNKLITTFVGQQIVHAGYGVPPATFFKTFVFDENNPSYVDMPVFTPRFYISFRNFFFSADRLPGNQYNIYVHGKGQYGSYYGVLHNAKLQYVVTDVEAIEKVFDNAIYIVNADGQDIIGPITMSTETQTETFTLIGDLRKKYQKSRLQFPLRSAEQIDRMRGEHLAVEIEIVNDGIKQVILTGVRTDYRVSPKY